MQCLARLGRGLRRILMLAHRVSGLPLLRLQHTLKVQFAANDPTRDCEQRVSLMRQYQDPIEDSMKGHTARRSIFTLRNGSLSCLPDTSQGRPARGRAVR